MKGIPSVLFNSLQQALRDCDQFKSQRELFSIFAVDDLAPWRNGLPEANNLNERVLLTIDYLSGKRRTDGKSALIILLEVLSDQYDPQDERHGRLLAIINTVDWVKSFSLNLEARKLEANPSGAQMDRISEFDKVVVCARSVACVDVPCYPEEKQMSKNTGTAWLIAPNIAVTCRHVIEALKPLELSKDPKTIEAQVNDTVFTFDYTVTGKGLQYRAKSLEYDSPSLDYAILRLKDRRDIPLVNRGYLRIDPEAPLTPITSLYIIQHPLGQPQQGAEGQFIRTSVNLDHILYKTPTEEGTSGSPVINRSNWEVVAIHKGESKAGLREGLLMKSILSDLANNKEDLYQEIIRAQKKV